MFRRAAAVARRSASTAGVTYAGMALSLLSAPMLARALGADGRGALAGIMVTLHLVAWITPLGLPRGAAIQIVKRAEQSTRAVAAIGLLGVASAGIAFLVAPLVANGDDRILGGIQLGAVVLLFSGTGMLGLELTLLAGEMRRFNLIRATTLVLPSLAIIVLWSLGQLTFEAAFAVNIGCISIAYVIGLVFAMPSIRARGSARAPWGLSLRLWSADLFDSVASRIDVLSLSALAAASEVGVYAVSLTAASVAGGLTQALNLHAYSNFVEQSKRGAKSSLGRVSLAGGALTLGSGVVVVIGTSIFGEALFGPEFSGMVSIVAVLVVAQWLASQWQLIVWHESAHERVRGLAPVSASSLLVFGAAVAVMAATGSASSLAMAFAFLAMNVSRVGIYLGWAAWSRRVR